MMERVRPSRSKISYLVRVRVGVGVGVRVGVRVRSGGRR